MVLVSVRGLLKQFSAPDGYPHQVTPRFQVVESFVDFLERIPLGYQTRNIDSLVTHHVQHFNDVRGPAKRDSCDFDFLHGKTPVTNREGHFSQPADNRRRTAGSGGLDDLIGSLGAPESFESL